MKKQWLNHLPTATDTQGEAESPFIMLQNRFYYLFYLCQVCYPLCFNGISELGYLSFQKGKKKDARFNKGRKIVQHNLKMDYLRFYCTSHNSAFEIASPLIVQATACIKNEYFGKNAFLHLLNQWDFIVSAPKCSDDAAQCATEECAIANLSVVNVNLSTLC